MLSCSLLLEIITPAVPRRRRPPSSTELPILARLLSVYHANVTARFHSLFSTSLPCCSWVKKAQGYFVSQERNKVVNFMLGELQE